MNGHVSVTAPDGVPEVGPGDDLVGLLLPLAELADGDVLAVTSKVVSKAEGRLVRGDSRDDAITDESVRVVARRGDTRIVRTRLGLTMAAAGVDTSNVAAGTLALLPLDPDASAREIRTTIAERTSRNVAVVVTDTAGRAWREGQTDIAIGAAGLVVLDVHAGRVDAHGNELAVTAPAVADEIAGMAELAQGKLTGRPFAVVRGLSALVLAPGDHGLGAAELVRPEATDMFGYGAREAVVAALVGDPDELGPFGGPARAEELAAAVEVVTGRRPRWEPPVLVLPGPPDGRLAPLAHAHGWTLEDPSPVDARDPDAPVEARMRPAGP
jgi:coenzyme F420-0:L-glutamate ligase/coenzyme F420-1:gamma-L-glutamate ligase